MRKICTLPIQALDREQPVLPMIPGVPVRPRCSPRPRSPGDYGKCDKRHRAAEFLNFLKEIDAHVPEGLDIHIVMDATQKTPNITAWLARRRHYHVHFTPTSASWINQGRALVCLARQKGAPYRCSYLCQATRSRYPRLHRSAQRKSQALQMDQICRPNPGLSETLLSQSAADIKRRTLDSHD